MKYSVNLNPDNRNCFAEVYWTEHNNFEILSQEPFNNVLFEHEYEDITFEDLIEVDGVIQLDEAKYHATRNTQQIEMLRAKRAPLLHAFDLYKSNLSWGLHTETEEEREAIMTWYFGILDLEEEALNNVPEVVRRYL